MNNDINLNLLRTYIYNNSKYYLTNSIFFTDMWMNIIQNCKVNDTKAISSDMTNDNAQVFNQVFNCGIFNISITFNIQALRKLQSHAQSGDILLSLFKTSNGLIQYTKASGARVVTSVDAVHIVSCPFAGSQYLLVDGNHRVTMLKGTNVKKIPSYIHDFKAANISIVSTFDLSIYHLFHELFNISHHPNKKEYQQSKLFTHLEGVYERRTNISR